MLGNGDIKDLTHLTSLWKGGFREGTPSILNWPPSSFLTKSLKWPSHLPPLPVSNPPLLVPSINSLINSPAPVPLPHYHLKHFQASQWHGCSPLAINSFLLQVYNPDIESITLPCSVDGTNHAPCAPVLCLLIGYSLWLCFPPILFLAS